jgi:hypothetical protein
VRRVELLGLAGAVSALEATISAEAQLRGFLANYDPRVATCARDVRKWMQARMPTAVEFVYDKANSLVIGYGPNERASDAIFSIIVWPRWVSLCFLQGADLPDSKGILEGDGKIVRTVRLADAADLDTPDLRALIELALERADVPMPAKGKSYTLIRQVSATRPSTTRVARRDGRAAARPRR